MRSSSLDIFDFKLKFNTIAGMVNKRCITGQSDFTFTLETRHPAFSDARDLLMSFAELIKCPEYLHHYRITRLSLWNAASLGLSSQELLQKIEPFLRFPLPTSVRTFIRDTMALWGLLQLTRQGEQVYLTIHEPAIIPHALADKNVRLALLEPFQVDAANVQSCVHLPIDPLHRGAIKTSLMKIGLPVEDIAGYRDGARYEISAKPDLVLRPYQKAAADAFYRDNSLFGGSGVIVLPCGGGKTVVGLAIMARLKMMTLVLATNITALRQWKREILDKTELSEDDIGE